MMFLPLLLLIKPKYLATLYSVSIQVGYLSVLPVSHHELSHFAENNFFWCCLCWCCVWCCFSVNIENAALNGSDDLIENKYNELLNISVDNFKKCIVFSKSAVFHKCL